MKFKREHVYKLEKYEERLYKEVAYDLRPHNTGDSDYFIINPLKKARIPSTIRNVHEFSEIAQ
jgi:hypothetical protein